MSNKRLELCDVTRSYQQGQNTVVALKPVSIEVAQGEVVALVGASGSGKSTLLHIAGLLMQPDSGKVFIDGLSCEHMTERQAAQIRKTKLGFVYQFHHLLPELTALENVMVPLMLQRKQEREKAMALFEEMELEDRAHHYPRELSGGEQQRVAIARALIHEPSLFLADEPTGNLDPDTAAHIEAMMKKVLKQRQASALIVTHNIEMAHRMDRVIALSSTK